MKLYQIANDYRELLADPDIESDQLKLALDAVDDAFDEKVLATAAVTKELKAEAKALKEAADAINDRRRAVENRVAWLLGYIKDAMEAVGKTRVDGIEVKVNIQRHKPGVIVNDYGAVPEEYLRRREITEVDKEKAGEDLRNGLQCNWCRLTDGKHVVIR